MLIHRRRWLSCSTQGRCWRRSTPPDPDHHRCASLLSQTDEDLVVHVLVLQLGVVDASILALVERLGESKLSTFDHRHFSVLRPAHVEALRLLP